MMLRSIAFAAALLPAFAAADEAVQADAAPIIVDSPVAPETAADAPPAPAAAPETPPPASPEPPTANALPPPAAANAPSPELIAEQRRFEQFRRDLVSLLALRAEPDLLVAATELAFPDGDDKARPAVLKPPSLIRRAQKFGAEAPLVWWVSTFVGCGTGAPGCQGEAAARLQALAPDNAAVWLPSLHVQKDAGQARALLAAMAQAQRFDDYWSAGVLAVYRALQVLPVPAEVLGHGLNPTAARINLATGVGGGFLPNYARLGELCHGGESTEPTLASDCLAIAHLLENGGSFRSQAIGFAIEDSLLPAGTARDVLHARQRASTWQKLKFLELSARFASDEALAKAYLDQLGRDSNEQATVTTLLRAEHVATDPPAGWQAPGLDPMAPRDPLALPPGR